jgi:hypothetical protein
VQQQLENNKRKRKPKLEWKGMDFDEQQRYKVAIEINL